jgi:HlyD family secretion protein
MQVDTSVDEADAGYVAEGAMAKFSATAYANEVFSGKVQQVRVNPIITNNVVTYDAVIRVNDTSGRLLPGMTTQVSIEAGKRVNVLSVPIAAVLYRPLQPQTGVNTGGFGGGGFGAGVAQTATPGGQTQAVAGAPGSEVTLWILLHGHPTPRQVVIGLSDGNNMEIRSGDLHEGDLVIIAQRRGGAGRSGPSGASGTGANAAGTRGSGTAQGTGNPPGANVPRQSQ